MTRRIGANIFSWTRSSSRDYIYVHHSLRTRIASSSRFAKSLSSIYDQTVPCAALLYGIQLYRTYPQSNFDLRAFDKRSYDKISAEVLIRTKLFYNLHILKSSSIAPCTGGFHILILQLSLTCIVFRDSVLCLLGNAFWLRGFYSMLYNVVHYYLSSFVRYPLFRKSFSSPQNFTED